MAILTMDIAQERHVLYIYITFACHARAPTPESPVWTKKIEDWSTGTSDTRSVPQHLLTIEHDQVYYRPSLSSKHTLPDRCTTTFTAALSYLYPSIEAHKQMHSQHTEISTHTCMPSTDAHQQIHSLYTEANTQASMPSIETHHQTHTEASMKSQMHSIHSDTTQAHTCTCMANFPQQLSCLIIAHQLDKKPCIPMRLHAL